MALTINTNVASLNAQRNLGKSQSALARSMQRLSSGLRINSAKDDAAGLAISDRMTAQIRGLNQAVRNSNDGISMAQTAEGALQESTNILQRMREIAVQAANDTNTDTDRSSLQAEVTQLISELDRVASSTAFNGKKLLDGTLANATFQVGADSNQNISFSIENARAASLGDATTSVVGGDVSTSAFESFTQAGADLTTAAGVLSINGSTVSWVEGSSDQRNAADLVAGAIDALDGFSAVANATTMDLGAVTAITTTDSGDLNINGTFVGVLAGADGTAVAAAINGGTGSHGVTADYSTGSMILTSADGSNIEITADGGATGSFANLDVGTGGDAIAIGSVDITADAAATIDVGLVAANGATLAAGDVGRYTVTMDSLDVSSQEGANDAIASVDQAISQIDSMRGDLGAVQNRFESTIANLQNVAENLSAARSRILDADIAEETSALTKNNILQQAGIAILAQANQAPNAVLTLLG